MTDPVPVHVHGDPSSACTDPGCRHAGDRFVNHPGYCPDDPATPCPPPRFVPYVEQVRRTKGYRRPPGTVMVDRSGPWGNPFHVGDSLSTGVGLVPIDHLLAVVLFEQWVTTSDYPRARWIREHVHQLEGRILGCWCDQSGPCHAQVLARLANPFAVPPAKPAAQKRR